MDFDLSEAQQAVAEAAAKLFEGELTDKRRLEVEAGTAADGEGGGFDKALWGSLAEANLLGLAVSEEDGGSGLGFTEVAVLLEEAGRSSAPVPLWASLVLGAMPVAAFGSAQLRRRLLAPLVRGETVLTAALVEDGAEPHEPATEALGGASGWRINGSKTCVPAGTVANAVLVPARSADGLGVFVVDPAAPGVSVTPLDTTTGTAEAHLELDSVEVGADGVLAAPPSGGEVVDWLLLRANAGLCSLIAGACQSALRLTSEYAASRQQFGRAIATFQAVSQRAADAYVDAEAVLLTARQAAWRLGEGLPSAEQVAIAKFWAAEGGQRVVHAAQHIHGGVGVDRSYPLHRHFLLAKQLELTLGGATESLLRLGSIMAEEGV